MSRDIGAPSGTGSRPADEAASSAASSPEASIPSAYTLSDWLRRKAARCDDIGDSTDFSHAAEIIDELYYALEICLAMAQRKSLTSPLNRNGQSPYDIGIAALRKARAEQESSK